MEDATTDCAGFNETVVFLSYFKDLKDPRQQGKVTYPLVSTNPEMELSAAMRGLGLIYTFEEFLAPALVAGRLVEVMDEWAQSFPGPYLYYASRSYMPAPLRAFVDFIKQPPTA